MPFLPVQTDFHPKRNQARQKLATLPVSRFQDLAFDVYTELERRSPHLISSYVQKFGDRDGTYAANEDLAPSQQKPSSRNAGGHRSLQQDKKEKNLDNLMADLGNFAGNVRISIKSFFFRD